MTAVLVIYDFNSSPLESRIIAVMIFVGINALPFLFTKILISNYDRLDKAEILTKYGSIYSTRRVSPGFVRDHLTFLDPLFFFARRTTFIFVCIYKLEDPHRQMVYHDVLTMLSIVLIGSHEYDSRVMKGIELATELLLLLTSAFIM